MEDINMRTSNKSLKAQAREHLHGNYGVLIGTFFILYAISLASTQIISFSINMTTITGVIIYNVAIILFQLIFMIFTVGCVKQTLDISSGKKARINTMFYGFTHHPNKSIGITLLVGLYVFGVIILFLISGVVLSVVLSFLNAETNLFGTGMIICYFVILYFLFLLVIYAATLRYSLVYFLLADYEEYSCIQIMKLSSSLMKGNKFRLFGLYFSFIGMFLLGMLSCGIGFLWIQPYIQVTMAEFYLSITAEKSPTQPTQPTYDSYASDTVVPETYDTPATFEAPEIPEITEVPEVDEPTETTY